MYTTRKTRCSAAYDVQPGEHIQASTRHYEMHCRMQCKRRTTAAWRNATFHSPAWAQARASPTRTDEHLDDELLVGHTIAHLAVRAHQRAITRRERRDLRQRVCLQHASGRRPMAVMALAAKAARAATTNTQPSAGKRGRRRTGRQVGRVTVRRRIRIRIRIRIRLVAVREIVQPPENLGARFGVRNVLQRFKTRVPLRLCRHVRDMLYAAWYTLCIACCTAAHLYQVACSFSRWLLC